MPLLPRRRADDVRALRRAAVDEVTLKEASRVVDDVRGRGEAALREHAERLGDVAPGGPLFLDGGALRSAFFALPASDRALLERTLGRIRGFAEAQLAALAPVEAAVPGGRAGHRIAPVERAGCYAPGGRFPLPSSVLMTAGVARVAGVREVWVASPKPKPITLAAAHVAGADGLLAAGGAQAIAALAFGAGPLSAADTVVGPGNRWVTAAKQRIAGQIGIDLLAGPSELLIIADRSADPKLIAADLLAQAEHDTEALPALVATDAALLDAVDAELLSQLSTLPTRSTAEEALEHGFAVLVPDLAQAALLADRLAPEHLEVLVERPAELGARLGAYGALFLGPGSAEVFGDYGIGPNHVLPTGGGARSFGGLSVLNFLRVRTWLDVGAPDPTLVEDAAALARLEGLEAHARAAERRRR
jgi:phosphoribosyl-ATP pyrophosphohydrolase/phosphoribosyl-AMP cyclohydrolase/histidinol dehydrogenase